jgi:pyruvate/2-oxoglutarate dehydrogenase complex dihydrolipoamide acyltransferase (E2) component
MFVFELPEIGEGVLEGEIVRWLVKVGDEVTRDQPLCEILTDKATVVVPSPRSGRIAALHGTPGDVVKVQAPLVEIALY